MYAILINLTVSKPLFNSIHCLNLLNFIVCFFTNIFPQFIIFFKHNNTFLNAVVSSLFSNVLIKNGIAPIFTKYSTFCDEK